MADFRLSACAEMLWPEAPMAWRCARLHEMGLGVGLWNWAAHDIDALAATGAHFTIMNGYSEGRLTDEAGAQLLLHSARDAVQVGRRLGVERLNLTGTALGAGGIPTQQTEVLTGPMWLKARDTLHRVCDLAEAEGVTFTLENLNPLDHPGCPFGKTADVLALVAAVDRPQLRINLDLYHTQLGEGDLLRWCARCLPWIGEIQVADNPGRHEPGTGEINYPAVASGLAGLGYGGTVTLEAWPADMAEAAIAGFRAAFTL